jgi:hypothetical protein
VVVCAGGGGRVAPTPSRTLSRPADLGRLRHARIAVRRSLYRKQAEAWAGPVRAFCTGQLTGNGARLSRLWAAPLKTAVPSAPGFQPFPGACAAPRAPGSRGARSAREDVPRASDPAGCGAGLCWRPVATAPGACRARRR